MTLSEDAFLLDPSADGADEDTPLAAAHKNVGVTILGWLKDGRLDINTFFIK